jgi:hypothetical protein
MGQGGESWGPACSECRPYVPLTQRLAPAKAPSHSTAKTSPICSIISDKAPHRRWCRVSRPGASRRLRRRALERSSVLRIASRSLVGLGCAAIGGVCAKLGVPLGSCWYLVEACLDPQRLGAHVQRGKPPRIPHAPGLPWANSRRGNRIAAINLPQQS